MAPVHFYSGPVAEDIVAAARLTTQHPNTISLEDMASYKAVVRKPVCIEYRKLQSLRYGTTVIRGPNCGSNPRLAQRI